jgi:hypothetical protein
MSATTRYLVDEASIVTAGLPVGLSILRAFSSSPDVICTSVQVSGARELLVNMLDRTPVKPF